jgi:hypothetical protein
MAFVINPDGTKVEVKPKGRKFTLDEMQALVGPPGGRGLIQQVPLRKRYKHFSRCWCNEEGAINGMEPNEVASLEIANVHHLFGPVVFTLAGEF